MGRRAHLPRKARVTWGRALLGRLYRPLDDEKRLHMFMICKHMLKCVLTTILR